MKIREQNACSVEDGLGLKKFFNVSEFISPSSNVPGQYCEQLQIFGLPSYQTDQVCEGAGAKIILTSSIKHRAPDFMDFLTTPKSMQGIFLSLTTLRAYRNI